jgi:GT2 family glycosyltransferase
VLAVTGASFIIRRNLFNRVRGFDTVYGKGYYEDSDLCMKVRSVGARVYINTEATATHGVGQTFKNEKSSPIQQNQMIFRSRWINQLAWDDWSFW